MKEAGLKELHNMLFQLCDILEEKQSYNYGEKTSGCQEFRDGAESWLGEAQRIF